MSNSRKRVANKEGNRAIRAVGKAASPGIRMSAAVNANNKAANAVNRVTRKGKRGANRPASKARVSRGSRAAKDVADFVAATPTS